VDDDSKMGRHAGHRSNRRRGDPGGLGAGSLMAVAAQREEQTEERRGKYLVRQV
jgi:hypothetical protein